MRQILFVKTSSMGDIIHHFAVVDDILQHFPDAQIDWVVEEAFVELVRLHQGIRRVIPVAIRRWRKNIFSRTTWQEISQFKHILQAEPYDVVLDSQGLLKTAWITSLAKSDKSHKHGFAKGAIREPLARFVCGKRHLIDFKQAAIERYRQLAANALGYVVHGLPQFRLLPPLLDQSEACFACLPHNQAYVVCLFATARAEKYWQPAAWQTFGNYLASKGLACIFLWGSESERQLASELVNVIAHAKLAPKLSLTQAASLLQSAHLVVGVDTGLSHLSSLMAMPQIMIFGATAPEKYAPYWKQNIRVLGDAQQFPNVSDAITAFEELYS